MDEDFAILDALQSVDDAACAKFVVQISFRKIHLRD